MNDFQMQQLAFLQGTLDVLLWHGYLDEENIDNEAMRQQRDDMVKTIESAINILGKVVATETLRKTLVEEMKESHIENGQP